MWFYYLGTATMYAIVMARWWQILYGTICHHWFRASAVAVQGSKRDDGTGEGSSKSLYTWSIVMTLVCFHYISSSTRLRRTAPPLRLYILPWREIPTRISSIKFTICNFILLFPPSSAIPSIQHSNGAFGITSIIPRCSLNNQWNSGGDNRQECCPSSIEIA